jgi:hypothetical protein
MPDPALLGRLQTKAAQVSTNAQFYVDQPEKLLARNQQCSHLLRALHNAHAENSDDTSISAAQGKIIAGPLSSGTTSTSVPQIAVEHAAASPHRKKYDDLEFVHLGRKIPKGLFRHIEQSSAQTVGLPPDSPAGLSFCTRH